MNNDSMDTVVAAIQRSRIFAIADRYRAALENAFSQSIARRILARTFGPATDGSPSRQREIGVILLAAVMCHVALIVLTASFVGWMAFIIPAVGGTIALLAIMMAPRSSRR